MGPVGDTGPGSYSYQRQGRSRLTAALVLIVWLALLAAWAWLDASIWILGLVALFTVPALRDLWRNPSSGLTLSRHELSWYSGRRHAALPLSEIDHMRFDTSLDLSVRVTAMLKSGRKIRLPYEATPPHRDFESALHARAIKTERHHFTLIQ